MFYPCNERAILISNKYYGIKKQRRNAADIISAQPNVTSKIAQGIAKLPWYKMGLILILILTIFIGRWMLAAMTEATTIKSNPVPIPQKAVIKDISIVKNTVVQDKAKDLVLQYEELKQEKLRQEQERKRAIPIAKSYKYFSRGNMVTRQVKTNIHVSRRDVIAMASILEAECPNLKDWDRRLEANVILNRAKARDLSIKQTIEQGNGTQFNGVRTVVYQNKTYSEQSLKAAEAVLLKGERVLPNNVMYFTNLSTAGDTRFINSINWTMSQNTTQGHSFGVK